MSKPPPNGGLVRVVQATPEEVAAYLQTPGGAEGQGERWGGEKLVGLYFVLARESAESPEGAARHLFRKAGNEWKVIFEYGRAFYLRDTLGARYLDHLLHDPNQTISAFALEAAITPEKGEARAPNSIQPQVDARAKREYRQALDTLEEKREAARVAGNREEASRLDGELAVLKSALKEGDETDDTGERARSNVRHAVAAVREQLRRGGEKERAFAEHLRTHLSIGHECQYNQPEGRIWG